MLEEQNIFQMRKMIIILTILIIALSIISSVVGVLNYRMLNFESFLNM